MKILQKSAVVLVSVIAQLLMVGCGPTVSQQTVRVQPSSVTTTPGFTLTWRSPRFRDHAWAGRIWNVSSGSWETLSNLQQGVTNARFVLLGEQHDNPDHHAVQAELLSALIQPQRRASVGFEMFNIEHQTVLSQLQSQPDANPDAIAQAVSWDTSGWPSWAFYRPLVEISLRNRLPILATNLSRMQLMTVTRRSILSTQSVTEQLRAVNVQAVPEVFEQQLRRELVASHCDLLPPEAVTPMLIAQQLRDAKMAEVLTQSLTTASTPPITAAVLIAGADHVRTDRGVGWRLRQTPSASVVSVGMMEIDPTWTEPRQYSQRFLAEQLPFDFVVFTPAVEPVDHCAQMRQRAAGQTTQ